MKKILIPILLLIICINFAYADSKGVYVELLNQDPDPAGAGELVKLRLSLANFGSELTKNLQVELLPKYPFLSVEGEDYVKDIEFLSGHPQTIKFWVKIDEEAIEATNEIELRFKESSETSWSTQTFEVDVTDVKTDFDLVVQEINGEEVSLAIANVGKNVAYSTIIRIPEQESFTVSGTSGQMIGNLDDGDYTLVVFNIAKQRGIEGTNLQVQIDYTDDIGERRTINKEILLKSGAISDSLLEGTDPASMKGQRLKELQPTPFYTTWWFWGIVIVVLFVIWRIYKKKKSKSKKK